MTRGGRLLAADVERDMLPWIVGSLMCPFCAAPVSEVEPVRSGIEIECRTCGLVFRIVPESVRRLWQTPAYRRAGDPVRAKRFSDGVDLDTGR